MLLGHRAQAVEAIDRALAAKSYLDEAKRLRRRSRRASVAAAPSPTRGADARRVAADLLRRVITCPTNAASRQALGLLDQVLAESPPAAVRASRRGRDPRRTRAEALTGLRRFAEAVAEAERALARNASYAPAWAAKADAEDELGLAAAVDSFDRAVALDPSVPSVWVDRGYVLRKRGRLGDAFASYDRALAALDRRPPPIALEQQRATCSWARTMGRGGGAYDHALALDPEARRRAGSSRSS